MKKLNKLELNIYWIFIISLIIDNINGMLLLNKIDLVVSIGQIYRYFMILFFGYYPILYSSIEKIGSKLIRLAVKLAVFNIMITVVQLLLVYIFGIPFLEEGTGKIFIPVFALLMNVMFIIYDMLINRLTLLYKFKLEKRIKKYFK